MVSVATMASIISHARPEIGGMAGAAQLRSLEIDEPTLRRMIELRGDGAGDPRPAVIGELLANSADLRELTLSGIALPADVTGGVEMAIRQNALETLTITSSAVDEAVVVAIAATLRDGAALDSLVIHDSRLTEPAVLALAKALCSESARLRNLTLRACGLTPLGAAALRDALGVGALAELRLGRNADVSGVRWSTVDVLHARGAVCLELPSGKVVSSIPTLRVDLAPDAFPWHIQDAAMRWAAAVQELSEEECAALHSRLAIGARTLRDGWRQMRVHFCVEVAIECGARARRLRTVDSEAAHTMAQASRMAQLALCGVLADDPRTATTVWREQHAAALERAVAGECKHLIALPAVQAAHTRTLEGELGAFLRSVVGHDQWGWLRMKRYVKLEVGVFALLNACVLQPLLWGVLCLVPDLEPRVAAALSGPRHMYWAAIPGLRLLLDELSGCLLLGLCVSLPPRSSQLDGPRAEHAQVILALLTCVGSLLNEADEIVRGWHSPDGWHWLDVTSMVTSYLSDEFNAFDSVGLLLALLGLTVHVSGMGGAHVSPTEDWVPSVMSVACLCLTLRLMRVFYLSDTIGPYLQMLFKMLSDTVKIVVLGVPIVLGFAFALHVLFRPVTLDAEEGCSTVGDPEKEAETEGDYRRSSIFAFVILSEMVLGGTDSRLDCLRQSAAGWPAWALQLAFMLVAVVLLLNTVIAAMSKSFDLIFESLDVNSMFVRAKLIQASTRLPIAPPPLNLLGLPSRLVFLVARECAKRMPPHRVADRHTKSAAETTDAADGTARAGEAGAGATSDEARLVALASAFIDKYLPDADVDERWRKSMARSMASVRSQGGDVSERLVELAERVDRLTGTFDERLTRLEALLQRSVATGSLPGDPPAGGGQGGAAAAPSPRPALRAAPPAAGGTAGDADGSAEM